jgi:hypothetical protein
MKLSGNISCLTSIRSKGAKTMKHPRLCAKFGALTLAGALAWGALLHPYKANANDDNPGSGDGASYLITVTDSNGNFFTRGILTLHADHTMSVVEADSGGPTYYFTSELGSWRPDDTGGAIGRALDFDLYGHTVYPDGDVARVDYTMSFQDDSPLRRIVGTETVTIFPLQSNPLGGGGTTLGTFNFTGQLITPPRTRSRP